MEKAVSPLDLGLLKPCLFFPMMGIPYITINRRVCIDKYLTSKPFQTWKMKVNIKVCQSPESILLCMFRGSKLPYYNQIWPKHIITCIMRYYKFRYTLIKQKGVNTVFKYMSYGPSGSEQTTCTLQTQLFTYIKVNYLPTSKSRHNFRRFSWC